MLRVAPHRAPTTRTPLGRGGPKQSPGPHRSDVVADWGDGQQRGERRPSRTYRLELGLGWHVSDLPERSPSRRLSCSWGTALPSLRTKLSVEVAVRRWPAVLCAKSLRRSGEVALWVHCTPHHDAAGGQHQALPSVPGPEGVSDCRRRHEVVGVIDEDEKLFDAGDLQDPLYLW